MSRPLLARGEERSMAGDPTCDFRDPASKGRLLGVLQREIDEMFESSNLRFRVIK